VVTSLVDPIDDCGQDVSAPLVIGMTVAHIGLGCSCCPLTTVESFTVEHDVSLASASTAWARTNSASTA